MARIGERGASLYVGDVYSVLKALVKAEFEAYALQRYHTDDELAEAIEELAKSCTRAADLAKWIQNRLRGIDEENPAA